MALVGVLFDFNKSTLQPASDGVLTQGSTLMTANPSLNVEIQGHTDNVGTDATIRLCPKVALVRS